MTFLRSFLSFFISVWLWWPEQLQVHLSFSGVNHETLFVFMCIWWLKVFVKLHGTLLNVFRVYVCLCVCMCFVCVSCVCVCVICVECSLGGLTWKFVISHCNENTKFEFTSAFSAHNEWICLGVWQQTFPKRGGKKAVNSKFLFSQQTTARKCTFLS